MDATQRASTQRAFDTVLTTTRAVRCRLDLSRSVELRLVVECLELALQAPSARNDQDWRWIIVTDAGLRRRLAEVLQRRLPAAGTAPDGTVSISAGSTSAGSAVFASIRQSSVYLVEHLHEVPVLVVACLDGRLPAVPTPRECAEFYGSAFPAVWSLQLALRSRGLGSALTTSFLADEEEIARILGVPSGVTMVAMLPVAHVVGDGFRPARRRDVSEVVNLDTWGHGLPAAGR